LQCIAGFTNPSAGKIEFENHTADMIFKSISIAAPYLELIEEMTANEQIDFHKKFKGLLGQISNETLLEKTGLKDASTKEIRNFSSGMKQRLKLGLAFFSDCPFLLLDEPCSNLDKEGQQIYLDLVEQVKHDKLIIVASNDPVEYQFCQHQIDIMQFKS
jgi:ABC-type multidrug transport system ATPase subunit